MSPGDNAQEQDGGMWAIQEPSAAPDASSSWQGISESQTTYTETGSIGEDGYSAEVEGLKAKHPAEETGKGTSMFDADASCVATCSTNDVDDDPLKEDYSYEPSEAGNVDDPGGALTSCVGTRWYKAPELLYGSTDYGQEIDLWSLGCIFSELLSLQPLFPGTSDIDQLGKILNVFGNLTEEAWPGCSSLPDYGKIFFSAVETPVGLEACLPNRTRAEVSLVRRLLCYDPMTRATAAELLQDNYFMEEPLPAPLSELSVPTTSSGQDEGSAGGWGDEKNLGSDSDRDDFSGMDVSLNDKGFSIRF